MKEGDIRTRQELGGGVLWDIGLYCINATRYLFRSEPLEVFAFPARSKTPRFAEIEEAVACVLRYRGDKLASFVCSFGDQGLRDVRIIEALYESSSSGRAVRIPELPPGRRPGPEQVIERPPVREPELVHTDSPHP